MDFGVDCRWICVDFSFALSSLATKAQMQNLKKTSRDPRRMSLLLRCAIASYCSRVFRIDVRTLHVQLCFVAYPQAHLVLYYIIL